MSKLISNDTFDGGLLEYQTANEMHVCTGDPIDRAAVIAASLASVAMSPAEYTIADGDVSGRKITTDQMADIPVTTTGQADTVCLIDAGELKAKTDVQTPQQLTSGNNVTVNPYKWEVQDPA